MFFVCWILNLSGASHEVLAAHVDAAPVPVLELRPDAGTGLADLVMRLLAKDPADRPATAAKARAYLEGLGAETQAAKLPAVEHTRVLSLPPETGLPLIDDALYDDAPYDDEPDVIPAPRRSVVPATGRRLAAVAAVAAVALLAVMGASQLRSDETPQADPSPGATKARTTPTPAAKPTATPTPKPKPKPKQTATPDGPAATLRALARLIREDADGRTGRTLRAAARDLDQAATAVAESDGREASEQYRDAVRRLAEAQRRGWQPSPQVVELFRQLGTSGWSSDRSSGDGDRNGD